LAVLPLAVGAEAKPRAVPVAVFVMWPFIFDTAYTIVRRLRNRENVFQPHRSHLYQRLAIAGWSHRAVSGLYGALAAMAAVIGVTPLFDPSLRQSADHAALWTIGIGIILLLALRK
jgi:UDP-N-acetylmuramyl pentapeptide phosphotransferase/UDP-N-acetylglucosamine-1-phosphate transferase